MNIVNSLLPDLKSYLVKYMSSDLGPSIIEKIEILEKAIEEKDPNNLNRIIKDTNEFIEITILNHEKKVLDEKRKEEKRNVKKKKE